MDSLGILLEVWLSFDLNFWQAKKFVSKISWEGLLVWNQIHLMRAILKVFLQGFWKKKALYAN